MKAIVQTKYGPPEVLRLEEIEKPEPADDGVLVKIHAASVNPADWHVMRGKPFLVRLMGFGLFKPKRPILGFDIAGTVEVVGKNVTRFQPGDEVFGGIGANGFAEYASIRERVLASKPTNLTFEEAAAVPVAGLTALQALRDHGGLQPGQKVLINGASGGVGTFAMQIAKALGAEATGVCSTRNLEMVRAIGADHVIDYTREDFTRNERRYDVVVDAAGYRSLSDITRILNADARYVFVGGAMIRVVQIMLRRPLNSVTGGKKIVSMLANVNQKDLEFLKELLQSGRVKPVIDRRYPLSEVPEAIRYLEEGHARGKVVITM